MAIITILNVMSVYESERRFLDAHLEGILSNLGREFSTAAFIGVFQKCYPQEYAYALRSSSGEKGFNVWVARWYLSKCSRVEKVGLSPKLISTTNGNSTRNHLWAKIQ